MSDLGASFRSDFTETPLLKKGVSKYHIAAIIGIPLAAILFQVYVPRFFERLSYLELPLLVTEAPNSGPHATPESARKSKPNPER